MKRSIIVIAVASVLAVAAGVAYATIPDSGGVISACYAKAGDLRVIDADAGGQCKAGESALSWSQTGPPGPAGPKGDRGPSDAYFVRRDGNFITVPHDDFGIVDTLELPAGKFVLIGTARFAQAPLAAADLVECIIVDPQTGFFVSRGLAQLGPGHSTDELTLTGSLSLDQLTTIEVLCKAGAAGVSHNQFKLEAIQVGSLIGSGTAPTDP